MNAELLLAHYERIAEAPDAIARLRRFVVDLAVRGKLMQQRPDDEDAGKLLSRISLQFKAAVEKGSLSRPKPALPLGKADALFALPHGWAFARVGEVAAIQTNLVDPKRHLDMPHVAPDNVESWTSRLLPYGTVREAGVFSGKHLFAAGAVLYSKIRPNLAKVAKVDFAGLCSADMYPLHPLIDRDFLVMFMITPTFVDQAVSEENRVAMPKINQAALSQIVVPVPPLAEQRRIVAKVNELMALCDRLEAARTAREATRDRLAAASLARLNTPDPETFPSDARFALDALPALTTRPDQIKHLRQTILNLAVRGKLVPQDARDEPAAALVARIAQRWKKQGVSHRREAADVCNSPPQEELPYSAPTSWSWLRAEALAQPGHTITYGILKPEWVEDGVPTVRVSEMKTGSIDVAALPRCDPKRAAKFAKTTLMEGDLLISKDGTIGKTAFVPAALAGGNITQHVLRFSVIPEVDRHFVKLVIDGPPYQAQLAGETKGVALQGVNVGDFRRMALPVPPLAEQHRIVAKVNELMSLCDALEASLAAATTARTRLLEATLAEALAPAVATQDIAA